MRENLNRESQHVLIKQGKALAQAMRQNAARRGEALRHTASLEMAAREMGFRNWNMLVAMAPYRLSEPSGEPAVTSVMKTLELMRTPPSFLRKLITDVPMLRIRPGEHLPPTYISKHTFVIASHERFQKLVPLLTRWINNPKVEAYQTQEQFICLKKQNMLFDWGDHNKNLWPQKTIILDLGSVHQHEGVDVLMAQARSLEQHIVIRVDPERIIEELEELHSFIGIATANCSSFVIDDEIEGPVAAYVPTMDWESPFGNITSQKTTRMVDKHVREALNGMRSPGVVAVWSPGGGAGQHAAATAIFELMKKQRGDKSWNWPRHEGLVRLMPLADPGAEGWLSFPWLRKVPDGEHILVQPLCASSHEEAQRKIKQLGMLSRDSALLSVHAGALERKNSYDVCIEMIRNCRTIGREFMEAKKDAAVDALPFSDWRHGTRERRAKEAAEPDARHTLGS